MKAHGDICFFQAAQAGRSPLVLWPVHGCAAGLGGLAVQGGAPAG